MPACRSRRAVHHRAGRPHRVDQHHRPPRTHTSRGRRTRTRAAAHHLTLARPSAAATLEVAVPHPRSDVVSVREGVNAAIQRTAARYDEMTNAKFGWHMSVIIEELETEMRRWGTYHPPREMMFISFMDGKKISRPSGWYTNPNFFGECNYVGMGTDGFTISFKTPTYQYTVRYFFCGNSFTVTEEWRDDLASDN